MSRLDSFIRRMSAQRACIDQAAAMLQELPGPVLELGLGNGRTYDHLRICFPGREIFVFDMAVAAHPDCVPEARYLRLGDFRSTVPGYLLERRPAAAMVHADIGSSSEVDSKNLAAALAGHLRDILATGGLLVCDQAMAAPGLEPMPLPAGVDAGRYHIYRRFAQLFDR